MLLQLSQVKTSLDDGGTSAIFKTIKALALREEQVISAKVSRLSVDARKKNEIHFVSSVVVEVENTLGTKLLKRKINGLTEIKPASEPQFAFGSIKMSGRPVVIGFGPAGMFSALLLAQKGYCPIVLERGASIDQRADAVKRYWNGEPLDTNSNVQFGEGGAGAFSDGKLTTRINDPLCSYVLSELVRHGAPQDILIKAKPHVGTDIMRKVVASIRNEIISLGGEIRFLCKAEGFKISGGKFAAVTANGEDVNTEAVIAAVGHSARDTFRCFDSAGAVIIPKPFSVGARIEHLQSDINNSLYGKFAGHPNLPVGEYQLSHRVGDRAAYTFCMCPGGMVVASASEDGQTVTNGMSYRARNLKNANSALVISVDSADYGESWRDSVAFQQRVENNAFKAGENGKYAPMMKVGDMLGTSETYGFGIAEPSYPRGVKEFDLTQLFPKQVSEFMINSLPILGKKLHGFDSANALLTGVETRTSSPVRILRKADFTAENIEGLYPCGEGAGYAGGITSAAVDGLRCAMAVMRKYSPIDI